MGQQPEIQDIYPLSFMQEGMLFHSLLDHDSRAYFEQAVFTISGQLDRERFQKSIDTVFERYDIFRTTFIHKNVAKPRQVVLKNRPSRVQFHDISHLDEKAQDKYADRFRKEDKDKGFDLQSDPLMRVSILKKAPERYVCIWSHHHIVMDGWCFGIVMKEFLMIYQSLGDERLPFLEPVQPYGKYIKWLMKQDRKEAEIFWKTRLADLEQTASLPKKSAEPNGELEQAVFTISEEQTNELKNIAARAGATLNTVFQALWGILLQRVSRCDDAVFGSVVSGRPSDLAGVEKMVGLFINTIPVRVKSGSFSFLELVRHLQQETLQAEAYSYYPLYDIQAQSPLKQALFDHIIVFENVPAQREIENVSQAGSFDFAVEDFTMEEVTNYGCSIKVIPGNSLYIRLKFDTGIYDDVFMKNIETFLRHMVNSVISDPEIGASEIALLDACEARSMMDAFNHTEAVEPPAPTLHGLFARRAALSPHRPALRFPGGMLTYAELDQYTDRLAVRLRQKGVRKESMVGVLAERSPEMAVSVLAVLKAGGAYVPLDPDYPEDRLRYMLEDSGACLLLAQPGLSVSGFSGETLEVSLSSLTSEAETGAVSDEADADSLAYIIYTSGSTGTPKGVAVEHRQAAAFLSGMQGQFPLTEEDVIVLKSSFSFDASIWQLFWWTISGASVYLLPAGWEKDPVRMIEAFSSEKVTTAHFIPAMVNSFLDALETEPAETRARLGRTLTRVFAGGEALSPLTAARFADLLPETMLIHGYGPTEATVDAAFYVCDRKQDSGRTRLPIGKPVPGARLYVLDSGGTIQPAGVAGELYIAGTGVARGYLNRPELTEERFVDDPFYPGERMYQTGDIARWTEDGLVEWLGRSDGQVKVRGYRIEPGEIEAAIRRIDGIREAAVTARTEEGETALYAYIEGRKSDDVRAELATRLPAYMMPAQFIEMSEWPVTPSGKLDRRALPAPGGAADRQAYTAPRNVTEMKLCALWEEVLKNGPVGIRDHFFERGGHSLKATALVSRIAKEFGVQVPLQDIFARPTVEELASVIQDLEESPYEAIQPAKKQDTYPVSSAQKRMYVLQQLEDGGVGYNMPAVLELTGPLDRSRLEETFRQLVERHESLRTSFETGPDGEPVQRIHDSVPFQLDEAESADAFVRPFCLEEAPLFRAALVKESEEHHLLLTDMHHIISDGVSVNTLIKEFGELYAGRSLAPMRLQYKDYAVWQRSFQEKEGYQKQEAYWLKRLEGELPVLELPADKPRPAVRSFAGGSVSCTLDADTASGLHRIARDHGSTLYMVLLAAYNTLLARLSGQEDIIVGSPIAGRPHKDLEPILGMFVNTLAIRTEPKGDKRFTDYLAEVRQAALEAYEHQDYPFEELVERLGVQRDTSRNPLFDVMFVLQNMERESLNLNELHLTQAADTGHKTAKFDATLYAAEGSDGSISFDFEFNTDIYQKQTIEKWLSYFTRILTKVIEDQTIPLGDIHVLDDAETNRVIYQFNQTKSDYPRHETISRLFERQAEETPDARAVVYDGQILTYRELNERANRIAAALRSNGVGPESVVALLTGRTTELASGILGILKAGGAYLPIGDDVPRERAEWMLKDCKADILLQSDKLDGLPLSGKRLFIEDIQTKAGLSSENPEPLGGPESLAYMIYTSGSTGAPKGVMIEQRSVIRLVKNSNYIDFTPKDRLLFTSSLGFDVTTFEIFGPLLNGASLYVSDQETYLDSDVLETFIQQNGITTLWLTSSLFNHLSEQNEHVFSGLSRLIIGGEALSPSHVNRVRKTLPHLSIWNGYGPTENTTFSTCFLIEQSYDHSIPIGRPVGNSTAYIINSRGTPQPIGVIGELCTGGDGVARGYFGRPELTEEKFVPNPFVPGERMYRTGDLARWLPDGTIEYAGRMDDQVKIRGYRVELGEIEAALRSLDGVKEAAVSVRTGQSGNKELIAYMSLQTDMDTEKVRSSLSKQLPNYMVPAYMMELEKLPLTPNGKLDRKNLPEPELALQTAYTAPRNELEEQLSVIWQEVLGTKQVGIEDSFFELGGDSIKALQVAARLGRYGWKMTASDLFRHPSIKELAPLIRKAERVIDQRPVEGDIPWTPVQHWFLSQRMENRNHFNQSVMMFSSDALHKQPLKQALEHLVIHHDALRITVSSENESIRQINHGIQKDELYSLDIWDLSETDTWEREIEDEVAALQQRMDIEKGPLLKAGWFKTRSGDYLFITVHHLAVDGVSWRILLEDLSAAYTHAVKGQPVQLPPKTDSFKQYAVRLSEYAKSSKLMREEEYWRFIEEETAAGLPYEKPQHQTGADSIRQTVSFTLTEEETSVLLQQVNRAYHTDTQDILLTAAALALRDWTGGGRLRIAMEGHGREHIMPELDISRTVGWFTSMYPVLIDLNTAGAELGTAVKTVKDTLGRIPDKGIGYGILKYMTPPEQKTIRFRQAPEISFNYLGQFNDTEEQHTFSLSGLASGHDITPTWQREQAVEMSAMAAQHKLHFSLSYPPSRFRKETMEQLLQTLQQYLRDIMAHCTGKEEAEKTVSDFSSKTLTSDDLDSIASFVEEL
ncbi:MULTISPECIES: non-ribosomal peptide synthetase [Bacillus amyloliquefaciens group]|uniref:non-ribosomal peptide synthetase n=1 Tax=Bacillus amyloliquefaciens group TaxID=1938374 RepID=UPI00084A1FC2|nr:MULTISPECIES: non-ribosomal peptide synthetase [Bacillus amyloliquefaciens group]AOO61775.1 non-ribosomal peptide synthetase [Bacillus velezensis]QHM89027.1 Plipastatin synthase subunit C [Bacillus velezensis]QOX73660.1 non-ribosomal peptide synthetase [Bacillus velezensis]QVV95615.1 non-ribosomal peptide synthetase [Bacillus amyloliquefaciens]QYR13599.1 non-ribosomal peptide synthetase [Bacillus velezensis]